MLAMHTSNTMSVRLKIAAKDSTEGITSFVAYSSNVFDARGGSVLIKADPSTMIAEVSGPVSAVAILTSRIEVN